MAEAVARSQPRWLMALCALALGACQTMVPRTEAPVVAPQPEPEVQRPVGDLPEDQQRHRVAVLAPTTGANAGVGQAIVNAANLAVIDTGGTNIRVTSYDTATGAAAAAERAIADGNRVILGPLLAQDVTAVAPIAKRAGVPLLSFSNDASVAGNGVYLLGYDPAQSVERVVAFASQRGLKRFAGLVPNGAYGERAGRAFSRAVEASGGRMVGIETYDRAPRSINAAVSKLATSASYDALLIADGGGIALQAAPVIRRSGGGTARILGTELWNVERALSGTPALRGAWYASVGDSLYEQLAAKYRTRFSRAPYRLASLGYDGVLLVTRVARDWRPGTAFPMAALDDAGGFAGIDGAFRFNRAGIAERMLEVKQVDAARTSVVSTAPPRFAAGAQAR